MFLDVFNNKWHLLTSLLIEISSETYIINSYWSSTTSDAWEICVFYFLSLTVNFLTRAKEIKDDIRGRDTAW